MNQISDEEFMANIHRLRPREDDGPPMPPMEAYAEDARDLDQITGRVEHLRAQLLTPDQIEPALTAVYLVKGWLDRGTASVVYGESNVGKTFLAMDLAMHAAAGLPWHGYRVAQPPGSVVYIASEGGHGIRNRITAVRQEKPELLTDRFRLLPVTVDLYAPFDAEALARMVADLPVPPVLIVIDTLARAMGEGDENTAKDMGAFIRSVDALRAKTGAHVMVIHHSGKDRSLGARGSNALRAAVDTEIELTLSGKVVSAEARKQRDMQGGKVFSYMLRDVTIGHDEDGDPVTSAVVEATDPVKPKPKVTGQALIALQALGDALAHHGAKMPGDMFPANRQCVSLEHWREYCDRLSLSSGESESARRKAFFTCKAKLQELGVVCVADGYAWRVSE